MACTDYTTRIVSYTECAGCGESIPRGTVAYRNGRLYRHEGCSFSRPAAPAPAPVSTEPSRPELRRNLYAGTCECGRAVAVGRGYLENEGGEWRVYCGTCGLSSAVG